MKSRKLSPTERIESLEVGEQCFIARSEWPSKGNSPPTLAHRVGKKLKRGFTHSLLIDHSGWIIERLPGAEPQAPGV